MNRYYLAVDIGASSGRHILGRMENGKMKLREIYRFSNGMKMVDGTLCWNLNGLFEEIKAGMRECKKLGITRVLMTCKKENTGSAKSIMNNGGILENEIEKEDGTVMQRYWITL